MGRLDKIGALKAVSVNENASQVSIALPDGQIIHVALERAGADFPLLEKGDFYVLTKDHIGTAVEMAKKAMGDGGSVTGDPETPPGGDPETDTQKRMRKLKGVGKQAIRPWKPRGKVVASKNTSLSGAAAGVANKVPKNTMASILLGLMQSRRAALTGDADVNEGGDIRLAFLENGEPVPEHRDIVEMLKRMVGHSDKGYWNDAYPPAYKETAQSILKYLGAKELTKGFRKRLGGALARLAEENVLSGHAQHA